MKKGLELKIHTALETGETFEQQLNVKPGTVLIVGRNTENSATARSHLFSEKRVPIFAIDASDNVPYENLEPSSYVTFPLAKTLLVGLPQADMNHVSATPYPSLNGVSPYQLTGELVVYVHNDGLGVQRHIVGERDWFREGHWFDDITSYTGTVPEPTGRELSFRTRDCREAVHLKLQLGGQARQPRQTYLGGDPTAFIEKYGYPVRLHVPTVNDGNIGNARGGALNHCRIWTKKGESTISLSFDGFDNHLVSTLIDEGSAYLQQEGLLSEAAALNKERKALRRYGAVVNR